ncbi:MAG TPA: hypothetical protein VN694_04930 [Caulobacteraceae bacterium]|nr:hypothetical protein [Caulobacteraceae bacterium]
MNEITAWLAHPGLAQALLYLAILMAGVRSLLEFHENQDPTARAKLPSDPTA